MSSTDPTQLANDDAASLPRTKTTPVTGWKSTWKLEDSSIWWLSYFWKPGSSSGWLNNPGNLLLLTSVPFFGGAYFGYRMPTERLEDLIQGSTGGDTSRNGELVRKAKTADHEATRAVAARTASKALRIATLGTVGTFGFVGAVGFYMSGYNSLEEAVKGTTTWASSWGKSLEHLMGGDQAVSKTHPEVLATRHMEGNEELRYIYDRYIKEDDDEHSEGALWQDPNDTKEEEDPAPTLYSIYEKYFGKKDDE